MPNDAIREDVLKEAVRLACMQEFDEITLQAEEEPHEFSYEFVKRMKELVQVRKRREQRKMCKRYVLIAAIIIALSATTALAYEPIREKLYKMFVTLFSDHVEISSGPSDSRSEEIQNGGMTIEETNLYELIYIPEGYKLVDEMMHMTIYEKGEQSLSFMQFASGSGAAGVTSDGKILEEIEISGVKGYYTKDEDGYQSAMFERDGYMLIITGGDLVKEELIKIAEKVSKKN